MRLLKQIIASNFTFFVLITGIILSLNLTPLIMDVRHSPPGRSFALIHNNVQDYFFYLSLMSEGGKGQWLTTDPYTTEPSRPSIVFAYFLWLGKLSRILNLRYDITYHAFRILAGILLFGTAFYLIRLLKIPHPRLTYLFFVFATPLLRKMPIDGKLADVPFMNWWTGMDAIRRAAYLPHHVLGGFFTVMTIIFVTKYTRDQKLKYIILAVVSEAFLAFILTPGLMIILLSLPTSIAVWILSEQLPKRRIDPVTWFNQHTKLLSGLFLFWTLGLLFMIVMISQTRLGFPWSQYIAWEKKLQFPLKEEILGALGILVPFAFGGFLMGLISRKFEYIFVGTWLFLPIILIPYAMTIGISNSRLIQGVPYLPLSILAVLGLKGIEILISKFTSRFTSRKNETVSSNSKQSTISNLLRKRNFLIVNFIPAIGLVVFVAYSLPTLFWSLKDQIREYWPIFGNVYLDNRLFNSYDFINKNYPKDTIVLSSFYSGNMIPAYTHAVSFIGHFGYTYDNDRKSQDVMNFFSNKMTEKEAKEFLVKNKINLVFQSPEEKPLYNNYLYPGILKTIYDWGDVTIYLLK